MEISVGKLKDILENFDDELKIKFCLDDDDFEFANIRENERDTDSGDETIVEIILE